VPQAGSLTSSDAQQVLYVLGTDEISATYQARYSGNAADFAWVIAVPGEVIAVEEGDADLLLALQAHSAPQVVVDPASGEGGGGCGCGEAAGKGGDAANSLDVRGGGDTGVTVQGTGFAGDYEYTILGATEADALGTWLDEHGYDSSLIAPAIATYVADPLDWAFVAVRYAPDAVGDQSNVQLDPLRIRYGAAADGALHAIFPGMLGGSSSAERVLTEAWVVSDSRAALGGGWSAPANPDEKGGNDWDVAAVDYGSATAAWHALLLAHGDTARGMWMTWSGPYEGRWLTRYDAYVDPAVYTSDPVFTESGDEVEASTVIFMMAEPAWEEKYTGEEAVLAVGVGFVGLAAWRRRRVAR
jgi:hypothetical protein